MKSRVLSLLPSLLPSLVLIGVGSFSDSSVTAVRVLLIAQARSVSIRVIPRVSIRYLSYLAHVFALPSLLSKIR